jgi:hypothetical protein
VSDLLHWHGRPSELRQPPECCAEAAKKALSEQRDEATRDRGQAVHAERRRVVLGALEAIDAYWRAASSVLDSTQPGVKLAAAVVEQCRQAIQRTGCICPMVDVSALNEPPGSRLAPGGDVNCGLHGGPR